MENIEIGKTYKLKQDGEYFCIPLQRCVRFTSQVCVEVTNKYTADYFDPLKKDIIYFGKLIDMSGSVDYVTENEIEFSKNDVECSYSLRQMPVMMVYLPNLSGTLPNLFVEDTYEWL